MSREDDPLFDLRHFMALCFHYLGLPEPTRLQYWMGHEIQYGHRLLCFLCFRTFAKSLIFAIAACHRLYWNRDDKFLATSGAHTKSKEITRFMLKLCKEVPELRCLLPARKDRQSVMEWDVPGCLPAQAPSVRSLGIMSNSLNGARATFAAMDDIETKKNSQTPLMRERIADQALEVDGAILRSEHEVPDAKVVIAGTPQIEDSYYFRLSPADADPSARYVVYAIPVEYPDDEARREYDRHGVTLCPLLAEDLERDPTLVGKPTEPTRYPEKELLFRRGRYGLTGYRRNYMLLPGGGQDDRYPLHLRDLIVTDADSQIAHERLLWSDAKELELEELRRCYVGFAREMYHRPADSIGIRSPYQRGVMAVDPSGKGGDETAWVVLKAISSQIYLLDVGGHRHGSDEAGFRRIATIAKQWGITQIIAEQNFGGGMWSQLLRPFLREIHPGCGVEDVPVHGKKEERIIRILDPVVDSHRLVVNRQAIVNDYESAQGYQRDDVLTSQLFYQMSRLTSQAKCLDHDDRIDALSLGVHWFEESMARDFKEEMEERRMENVRRSIAMWRDFKGRLNQSATEDQENLTWLNPPR